MTLSNPVTLYGVHQVTIVDRTTKAMHTALVVGSFGMDNKQEQKPLQGGSNPYPFDTAPGYAEAKTTLKFMQYDLNLLRYLGGDGANAYTEDTDGDAAGVVSSLTNEVGTSVANATTGIASIAPKSSENPVFGDYFAKATGAATVDIYLNNNLGGVEFQDDTLKITASALTVPGSGGTVDVPDANLTITGGSGTVAFVTADIASFNVKPINTYNFEYKFGADGNSLPEFSMYVLGEKLDSGEASKYRSLYMPRVKGNGVSFESQAKEWSSFETEITVLFDATAGYAAKMQVINR